MLTREPEFVAALLDPSDPDGIARANARLSFLEQSAGVTDIYVMDFEGNTIAASNWNKPVSFVGHKLQLSQLFSGGAQRQDRTLLCGRVSLR